MTTPKKRVIAYLKNLSDGKEKTAPKLFQEAEDAAYERTRQP